MPLARARRNEVDNRVDDAVVCLWRQDVAGKHVTAGVKTLFDRNELFACGTQKVKALLLQGRPIDEPVVQHGPFVMNTKDEIVQAIRDYQASKGVAVTGEPSLELLRSLN